MTETDTRVSKAPKTVTDDDIYRASSQFKKWSFTQTQLDEKRLETNTTGVEWVKSSFALADVPLSNAKLLSVQEELAMVNYMCSQSEGIAQILNLPSKVKATAVLYFKKFFLMNSLMVYTRPRKILDTCFFLAGKSENYFFSINQFCKLTGAVASEVLELEFVVMQSLMFSLSAQSAYPPLHGFYLDIQTALPQVPTSTVGSIYDGSRKYVSNSFLTDTNFLYTPPQISLAAMMCANREVTEQYLRVKLADPAQYDQTSRILEQCVQMIAKVDQPTMEYVKDIIKKLSSCDAERAKARLLKRKLKEETEGGDNAKKQKLDSETPQPQPELLPPQESQPPPQVKVEQDLTPAPTEDSQPPPQPQS